MYLLNLLNNHTNTDSAAEMYPNVSSVFDFIVVKKGEIWAGKTENIG